MDSIRNLIKKINSGRVVPLPPNRLAKLRHRRGKRGHETAKYAK